MHLITAELGLKAQPQTLPSGHLDKAIAYTLNHWEYLHDILPKLAGATNHEVGENWTPSGWGQARGIIRHWPNTSPTEAPDG